ncbi:MmgE/PrpD family protein [Solwaraspora sp. WMMD937]|uniref:MmgE/PrpD family protein n=1 Tax=Solwaraspora sp. WMMD937 TaxID=3016090 RepID=UPI00249C69CE|nr:MmgE/PrpD family protein [Solwaraspora sp. WMMD937]WFE19960.1 MmgE/PrpD family protein [Solwaraspora sp. WMMD937]
MADATLESITAFAMDVRHARIPPDAAGRVRDVIVDTVACAVAGQDCLAARAAREMSPPGDGVLIGRPERVAVEQAAFANTAAIRYLDFNDTYPAGHPSDLIGALIAAVAATAASGAQLHRAVAAAHEVYTRFAETVLIRRPQTIDQGYGISIAATVGLALLYDLNEQQTRDAIAIAATNGLQLRASRAGQLSDYKGVATAFSTRDAVFTVGLAARGMTGPAAPFDGRHGIVELLTGEAGRLEIAPFDGNWKLTGTRLKFWPVAYNIQPAIWAALDLRERIASWRDVERLTFHTAKFLAHESGSEPEKWDPKTRETADHSLPYAVWRALSAGRVDEDAFTPEAITDPHARDLMRRITVVPDPDIDSRWPAEIGVRLVAHLRDGTEHTIVSRNPRGHEANPLDHDDLRSKFLSLTTRRLGADRAGHAFDLAWSSAELGSALDLLTTLHATN